MPFLRRNRIRRGAIRNETSWQKWDIHRRGTADRLREKSDLVMKIRCRSQTAIPPRGKEGTRALGVAGLAFDIHPIVHRRTDSIDARDNEGIKDVVEWIAIRRTRYDRSGRARLVVIIDDLGQPFHIELPRHIARFRQIDHEEIAI